MTEELKIIITVKDNSGPAFQKFGENARRIGTVALGALAVGLAGATAGFIKLGQAISEATDLAVIQRQAEQQLDAVIKSTGGAAGVTADEIKEMASSLQTLTNTGDEAIIGGQNLLLTFTNIGEDVFPQATETMLNMSAALGQDLKSSALQLGKALNDPIIGVGALREVGVSFTESQVDTIKRLTEVGNTMSAQKMILRELERQFGDSAEAMADPAIQLSNAWGDFKEQIGSVALVVRDQLAEFALEHLGGVMEELQPKIDIVKDALGRFLENVLAGDDPIDTFTQLLFETGKQLGIDDEVMKNVVITFINFLDTVNEIITTISDFWQWLKDLLSPITEAIGGVVEWEDVLKALGITIAAALIPAVVSLVASMAPILLTFAAITAAIVLLREAWDNNFLGIRDAVESLVEWFKNLGETFSNLELPDWLVPGSPTPLELGIRGINDAVQLLSRTSIPQLNAGLNTVGGETSSNVQNQTFNLVLNNGSNNAREDFHTMVSLGRL